MHDEIPFGQAESERLEFKDAAVVTGPNADLAAVGREVVAMLNAKGGEIWLGLGEEGGRAVRAVPVPGPDEASMRLRNHLSDAVEPVPGEDEVRIESVELEDGSGAVLRLVVTPRQGRKPYAHLRHGARLFAVRTGARITPMARQELRDLFVGQSAGEAEGERRARERLRALAEQAAAETGRGAVLWLGVAPLGADAGLDLQNPHLVEWLRDPTASGNRRGGWTFANPWVTPQLGAHGLVLDSGSLGLALGEDGCVSLRVTEHLLSARADWEGRSTKEIYALALLELPVSVFRLLAAILATPGLLARRPANLLADIALFRARRLRLCPYEPHTPERWDWERAPTEIETEDLVFLNPLALTAEEVLSAPDRPGLILARRIFQAFGWREADLPRQADFSAGRLRLE